MVLHHLHSPYVIMGYAICCYTVFTPEKIISLNIKSIYFRPLILNLAVVCHINAGHTLQYIPNGLVLLLSETTYIICNGISIFSDAVCFHHHLLQLQRSFLHKNSERSSVNPCFCSIWLVAEHCGVDEKAVSRLINLYGELAFLI